MRRRIVLVAVLLLLLLALGGGACWYTRTESIPPSVEAPRFDSSGRDDGLTDDQFADLARTNPVGMFEECMTRYVRETKGFRATLEKRERIQGELRDRERVKIVVEGDEKDPPTTSVRMIWEEGFPKGGLGSHLAGTLYVSGANANEMQTYRPDAFMKTWSVDVKGSLAQDASRYCITDSGIYRGMLRTYTAWKTRKEHGELRTEYLGLQPVEKAGGRVCHVIRRTCPHAEVDSFALDLQAPHDPKVIERDGFTEVTVMIDAERRLHVGTELKNAKGELVGEYYFRDVELSREPFPPDTFKPAAIQSAPGPKK